MRPSIILSAPLRTIVHSTTLLVLSALLIPVDAGAQDLSDRLTVDRYLDWEFVRNPQLSPDGRQIIYEREWIDKVHDGHVSDVWIMNADGSRNRFLVDGSSPLWSPDGTRIAYVAQGEPSGSQIFVRWMDSEGTTSQVTRLTESPSGITWSPDGRSIAFNMLVDAPPDPEWRIDMPTAPADACSRRPRVTNPPCPPAQPWSSPSPASPPSAVPSPSATSTGLNSSRKSWESTLETR